MGKKHTYFDYSLLFVIFFLMAFGLLMLYSASYSNASVQFLDGAYFLKNQLKAMILGTAGMVIMIFFPYKWLEKLSFLIYLSSFALCVAVIFMGTDHNGSRRWLEIGPIQFQPSEAAKIAMIIFVAAIIAKIPKQMGKITSLLKIIALVLPVFAVIAYQNLSTAIIVIGIPAVMMFVASPKYMQFVVIGLAGLSGIAFFVLTADYRGDRFSVWLHPENYDKGYQTLQGLYAIGSGGLFGKGLGNSIQTNFLPEAENDMIFSIICEQLGIFGAIALILLFVFMLWRFMTIANNAKDLFASMLVVGIMAHIAIQVVLNIAVVTNSIPNTGVTLPFVSYGGTSILFLMAEMGIALGVSRQIRIEGE